MKQFIVEISDAEEKALLTDMISIQEWIDNAIHNKARQVIDNIITKHTDKNAKKMLKESKELIIQSLILKTAAERVAEFEEQVRC